MTKPKSKKPAPLRTPRRRLSFYESQQWQAAGIVRDWITRQKCLNTVSPETIWIIEKLIEDLET